MIVIKRILNWEEATLYQSEWDELLTSSTQIKKSEPIPSIFQTYEWNKTWWDSFGHNDEHKLLLLFGFDEDLLIGIAPLMIKREKKGSSYKVINFIGASNSNWSSDYCSFISRVNYESVINEFLYWLNKHSADWDELEFKNIPGHSKDFNFLRQMYPSRSVIRYLYDAPFLALGKFDKLSNIKDPFYKHHHNIKNINRLKKSGDLKFNQWVNEEDIIPKLDLFFKQHIERRSKTPFPSFFEDEYYKNYFKNFIHTLSTKGWVVLFTITLNEETLSHYLTFKFQNKIYLYTPTFNIKFKQFSPGTIQLNNILEYALNQKLNIVDFGAGGEAYKYRFSNCKTRLYLFKIFKSWRRYILFKLNNICHKIAHPIMHFFRLCRDHLFQIIDTNRKS